MLANRKKALEKMRWLILFFTLCATMLGQLPALNLSAELESGNPDLKICYDGQGAIALYKTGRWLFSMSMRTTPPDDEGPLKPFFYQGFKSFEEFLSGRIGADGRRIASRHTILYPCGPRRGMAVTDKIINDGMPQNWDGRTTSPDPGKMVWGRLIEVFEAAGSSINLLDENATAQFLSSIMDDPADEFLGWLDGRIYWCKKGNYRYVYWRTNEDRSRIHTIDTGGKMYYICGIVKMKSGAVGMMGWREPGLFSFAGRRTAGLFELAK